MYFIPQKSKWYSKIVHTHYLYRYGSLIILAGFLFVSWYTLYMWLEESITQEQIAITQLQNQLMQQSVAKAQCTQLSCQLPILKDAFASCMNQCIGTNCCDQCSYIFDQAQKVGLRITGYQAEKEIKLKNWRQNQYVNVTVSGTLDQLQSFLQALKKSERMIQCPSMNVQRLEGTIFTAQCSIQFITAIV